jgi:hypothetical protein
MREPTTLVAQCRSKPSGVTFPIEIAHITCY